MALTHASIVKDIQSGKFAPVYFLQGEESFFIDNIIQNIEANALEDAQRGFNQMVFYGKEANLIEIIGAARQYPMLGNRQVIVVKEAQELRDWSGLDAQKVVANYLKKPLASTILVFAHKYKKLPASSKLGKLFQKHAIFLTSKKLYDNQIPNWISDFVQYQHVTIDRQAIMMLSENIGNNLQRIANEIKKLCLNLKESNMIDAKMIQRYVGINKEYNIFELQRAIGTLNRAKALIIVQYFAANPSNNPLIPTIYSLFLYFSKLLLIHDAKTTNEKTITSLIGVHPFFVKEYLIAKRNYSLPKILQNIGHIKEADLQCKGIGYATMKEDAILIELLFKLMN